MILIKIFGIINLVLLCFIILCAIDACRLINRRDDPWRSLAFYALALGAAGCLVWSRPTTLSEAGFQLMQDLGLVIICSYHVLREVQMKRIGAAWNRYAHHR